MVKSMIKRGLLLSPFAVAALAILGGLEWGLSAAIGLVLAIFNIWLAGRLIGGMAENNPQLIPIAGFAAFILALALLVVAALVIKQVESLDFPVTGLVLIGAHLILVTWEAANAFLKLPSESESKAVAEARIRS